MSVICSSDLRHRCASSCTLPSDWQLVMRHMRVPSVGVRAPIGGRTRANLYGYWRERDAYAKREALFVRPINGTRMSPIKTSYLCGSCTCLVALNRRISSRLKLRNYNRLSGIIIAPVELAQLLMDVQFCEKGLSRLLTVERHAHRLCAVTLYFFGSRSEYCIAFSPVASAARKLGSCIALSEFVGFCCLACDSTLTLSRQFTSVASKPVLALPTRPEAVMR